MLNLCSKLLVIGVEGVGDGIDAGADESLIEIVESVVPHLIAELAGEFVYQGGLDFEYHFAGFS